MARTGRPWAVVVTAVVAALVAAGALAAAATLRHRNAATIATSSSPAAPSTPVPGADGCLVPPCKVLATVTVGGNPVDLVADRDGVSGRLRIGGGGVGEVVEATITDMGAALTPESLQCVPATLSACLLRGTFRDGVVGQVVVGRSGHWNELSQRFVSSAGYLALADLEPDVGPEVVAAQRRCPTGAVCDDAAVFVEVYSLRTALLGCTRDYTRLESLPGWPEVDLSEAKISPCA